MIQLNPGRFINRLSSSFTSSYKAEIGALTKFTKEKIAVHTCVTCVIIPGGEPRETCLRHIREENRVCVKGGKRNLCKIIAERLLADCRLKRIYVYFV